MKLLAFQPFRRVDTDAENQNSPFHKQAVKSLCRTEFDESDLKHLREQTVQKQVRNLGEDYENIVEYENVHKNVEEEKYKVHSRKAAQPVNWTGRLGKMDSGSFEVLDRELFQHRSSSRKILQTTSKDYS